MFNKYLLNEMMNKLMKEYDMKEIPKSKVLAISQED